MARFALALFVFALSLSVAPASSEAAQTSRRSGGGGGRHQVVHDRIGPVLMHRALPPYWGLHVYKGR